MQSELIKAFQKVQSELKPITKNSQGYGYKYADLPAVWNAIKDVLDASGFVVSHEITADGVKTTASHEAGELSSFIPFATEGAKPQEIGSEITYYKRYNIGAIFNLIIEGEDDDAATAQETKAVPRTKVATKNCPDCGAPETMRKNGTGSYCAFKYKDACPPKKRDNAETAFADSLDKIPVVNK